MKKCISLVFFVSGMLSACTKNKIVNLEKPIQESISISQNISSAPEVILNLNYFASGSQLNAVAYIKWGEANGNGNYSVKFNIAGQTITSLVLSNAASCNATLSLSPNSSTTLTVTAQLINNSGVVVSSASQFIEIFDAINSTSQPIDPIATVTVNKPDPGYNSYNLKATNLYYLSANPLGKLYFYVFYVPTEYEENYQNIHPTLLGYTTIEYSIAPEGNLSVTLPGSGYEPSNLRVIISKLEFPSDYFAYPLKNTGWSGDYLIGRCINDGSMYDRFLRGLNTTNGRFSNWHYPSSMDFEIGSMDQMVNMQIYYCRGLGYL